MHLSKGSCICAIPSATVAAVRDVLFQSVCEIQQTRNKVETFTCKDCTDIFEIRVKNKVSSIRERTKKIGE